MSRQIVFMFTGQGFLYHRMGAELYEHHPVFKFHMDRCDEITRRLLGTSLLEILYRGKAKSEPFDRMLHTNPALLSIQYSLAQVLVDADIRPDLLLGCGLGEITASVVGGLAELEDALRLVIGMARMIEEILPATESTGIASATETPVESPANPECRVTGRSFVDPIAASFKAMSAEIPLRRAHVPIVSACRRWLLREPDSDYFWKIIRYPGEFDRTIGGLLEMGDFIFIDSGPCGTAAAFLEHLLASDSGSIALGMMDQTGRDLLSLEMLTENLSRFTENQRAKAS